MKKKTNQITTTKTKEQADEELLKKAHAIRTQFLTESSRLALDDEKRRVVLAHFLDCADQMAFEALVQFGSGLVGKDSHWSNGPELPEFIELLHPWIKLREKRIEAALLKIDDHRDPATQDLDEDFNYVKWTRQETSFKLGLLLGARLAGFPPEKVKEMTEYFVGTLR